MNLTNMRYHNRYHNNGKNYIFSKLGKIEIIILSLAGIALAIYLVLNLIVGPINREDVRTQLIGKTFVGTYYYGGVSKTFSNTEDTYRITFVDEKYCKIEYHKTTSGYYTISGIENGDAVYDKYVPGYSSDGTIENIPYELTGVFDIKFNWESQPNLFHSAEPFEIDIVGNSITLRTPNFNSYMSLYLEEE